MKFTKTLCGVTAALTVLSSTAIAAQAEETQLNLLTADISEVNGTSDYTAFGGGYYLINGKFYKIGEEQISEWQKSGKLTYQTVESILDVSDLEYWSGNFDGGYVQFAKFDADGKATERHVLHLDETTGKISTAYTLPAEWCYTKSNGYSLSFDESNSELAVNVYDPAGKKTTTTLSYSGDGELWYSGGSFEGGENVGYMMFQTKRYDSTEDHSYNLYDFEIYIVKKNGELEPAYKTETPFFVYGYQGGTENAFMWSEGNSSVTPPSYLYSINENKKYFVGRNYHGFGKYGDDDFCEFYISKLADKLYGTRAIIQGGYSVNSEKSQTGYILVDLRDDTEAEIISTPYKYMSTNDGKIYLVQTMDDKWGYIDSDGNELAIFDDASNFLGNYAPVITDGKAYLIDRSMNKVSDEIDGDSVRTADNEMFLIQKGDKYLVVSFTQESANKQNNSQPATSEPASSENTSNENNPATGFGMAILPIALLGGASIIVLRKRK